MNKSLMRISDSSARVALLLSELIKKPLDYNEIRKLFNDNNKKSVSTNEVLNKYINTLRTLGLDIKREQGKYTLYNFLVQIILSNEEIEAFNNLETDVIKYGTIKEFDTFCEIKKRILRFLDINSQKKVNSYIEKCLITDSLGIKIKLFGKFCYEGQTLKIRYKGEIYNVEPRDILFLENKIYFECYEPKTMTINKFPIEKITLVKQQPLRNRNQMFTNSFVYEIYGRLKENYKLKDGERILEEDEKRKVIKVENEDYEILAKRLIRYKDNCKVLKPEKFQKYFIEFSNKILSLYKEEIS